MRESAFWWSSAHCLHYRQQCEQWSQSTRFLVNLSITWQMVLRVLEHVFTLFNYCRQCGFDEMKQGGKCVQYHHWEHCGNGVCAVACVSVLETVWMLWDEEEKWITRCSCSMCVLWNKSVCCSTVCTLQCCAMYYDVCRLITVCLRGIWRMFWWQRAVVCGVRVNFRGQILQDEMPVRCAHRMVFMFVVKWTGALKDNSCVVVQSRALQHYTCAAGHTGAPLHGGPTLSECCGDCPDYGFSLCFMGEIRVGCMTLGPAV